MIETDIPINTKLGRYRITGKLGRGGMGIVYSGEDVRLKRAVAIKVLSDNPARGHDALQRFLLEARAAARLNHPNVVAVYDIGQRDGLTYIVMELVPGGSAQARLRLHGALPWRDATRIVVEVCRGLAAAHAAGCIHRDIKPGNILLGADGIAKLADFGLAKAPALVSSKLTQAGEVLGTPDFMSPEHCTAQPLDERTDLYSLGATYYALLVGRPPFDSPDVVKVVYAHCSAPIPNPCEAVPGLPPECTAIVARAMAKSRTARFRTALEMTTALESLLASTVPIAPPLLVHPLPADDRTTALMSVVRPPSLFRSRSVRWILALSGLGFVGVLILVGCLVGALSWQSAATPPAAPGPAVAAAPAPPPKDVFRLRHNPLLGHKGAVKAVSVSGGLIASVGDDATARLWTIDGGVLRTLQHPVALHAVALSPDGDTLATGGKTNTVYLWNTRTGEKVGQISTNGTVHALAFSPSGKQLVVGTTFELLLYDLFPARLAARLLPNHRQVSSVSYSADGKHLAVCTYEKRAFRWDVATLTKVQTNDFPQELVALAVSADGGRIAFVSSAGDLYLWQPEQGRPPAHLENNKIGSMPMAFLPGRNILLLAGERGSPLRLRDVEAGTTREIASGVTEVINALRFAPDGKILVAGCADGSVRLWDVVLADGL